MNLIQVFTILIQMGICQPATLTGRDGQQVKAMVCPIAAIMSGGQSAPAPDEEADPDAKDPAGDVSPPAQPGQKRT